jgi:hypothetical protein
MGTFPLKEMGTLPFKEMGTLPFNLKKWGRFPLIDLWHTLCK